MSSTNNRNIDERTVLGTGATSGLGEEAAAQLAEAGYAKIIVTGRTAAKAEMAGRALADRTGRDTFAPLTLDLDDRDSIDASVAKLASRGDKIDVLLLNAGLVAGKDLVRTSDGVEATFAATLIGHHRLTMGLLHSSLLAPETRIVVAGSEAARGDVPTMSRTDLPTFAAKHFDGDMIRAAESLIRQQKRLAMAAPVPDAASRYLKALTFSTDVSGQFFASEPKKMTGALHKMEHPHFADSPSQEAVWEATVNFAGADCHTIA